MDDARGHWVAKDTEGLIGGVFRTRKDALRFALFEVAGDSACVRVLPRTPAPSGALQQEPVAAHHWSWGEGERGTVGRSRGRPNSALASSLPFSDSLWRSPPFR